MEVKKKSILRQFRLLFILVKNKFHFYSLQYNMLNRYFFSILFKTSLTFFKRPFPYEERLTIAQVSKTFSLIVIWQLVDIMTHINTVTHFMPNHSRTAKSPCKDKIRQFWKSLAFCPFSLAIIFDHNKKYPNCNDTFTDAIYHLT